MVRPPLKKKSLPQIASSPLFWLILLLAAIALLTTIGPSEKTLGQGVRIVYLHGAWVWTALAAFLIAGMAGLAGLIGGKPAFHRWSRAWGRTGLLFWISYLPVSIWAMETSWNGLYLSEPRWRLALIFAVSGLLLQTGLALLERPAWTSAANLLYIVVLLVTLANTSNVMHPPAPVLSSDSLLIRGYFFVLLAIMSLAAWQIARLWRQADLLQARDSDSRHIQSRKGNPLKRSFPIQLTTFIYTRGVLNIMLRMVYPFLPVFGRGLGVDLRLLSLGITIRSASGVFGPFLASIGDTRGRKAGMLFGVGLFVAGTGLLVLWPSYPAFVLAMVLGIMANFTFVPSMQAFLGDRVPYRRRALVLGLTELGWSLSFIIGVPLVGLLIDRSGWRAPFPWLTGLGILAMLGLAISLPHDRPAATSKSNVWANLRTVLRYRPAQAGVLLCLGMAAANEMVNLTFGTWLEGAFQVKIAALAAASAVIGVSELSGEMLVTSLVDRLGKRRAVIIGLALSGLVFLALPMIGRTLTGALVGLFFIYLTFEFTVVSSVPLLTEVIPQARATFMSIVIASMALGRAAGALIVPLLFGPGSLGGTQTNLIPVVLAGAFLNLTAILSLQAVKIASSGEEITTPI